MIEVPHWLPVQSSFSHVGAGPSRWYQVFFRWRTWRRKSVPSLVGLTAESLNPRLEEHRIRFLEFGFDAINTRALVSLRPQESTSTAASKTKGQLCKAVSEQANSNQKTFAFENFPENVIRAKVERQWQSRAYIGSSGDLTTASMKCYIDRWSRANAE